MNGQRWTQEEVSMLRELSAADATLRAMASAIGRPVGGVRQKCRVLGLNFRDAREDAKDVPLRWDSDSLEKLADLVATGSAATAAEHFGLSVPGVRAVMRGYNIRGRGVRRSRTDEERANISKSLRARWDVKYPPNGPWVCTQCDTEKPTEAFPPRATSSHVCRDCRRAYHVAKTYGISVERYNELLAQQGGTCAICDLPETKIHQDTDSPFMLAVDHDHKCCPGKASCGSCVRALLCSRCNSVLGHVEAAGLLDGLTAYLSTHARS